MDTLANYTMTGSWLNNSYTNIQGDGPFHEFDLHDFAHLDAPDYLPAGSTHKVRRVVTGTTGELIATRTTLRFW